MMTVETIIGYFPELTKTQRKQFDQLGALYEEWNAQINVISRKDMDSFYERHVLHSLAIARVQSFVPGARILDVGTGGGFPCIPLAILFPEVQFTAVDSIGKKIKVVQAVADALGLKNVTAIHGRAENVQGTFDFVVSRAVTQMPKFVTWVKGKFSVKQQHDKTNGILYLKGGDLTEELKNFPKAQIFPISDHFEGEFFETKKIVYVPASR